MSPKFKQSQTGFGMATEAGGGGVPADEGSGADEKVKRAADEGGGAAEKVKKAKLQELMLFKRAEMDTMEAKEALDGVLIDCHSHESLPTATAAIEAFRVKTGGKHPNHGPRMDRSMIEVMTDRKVGKEVIQLLMDNDVSIDDRNKQGRTALHIQAMNGRLGEMEMLLGFEADINAECPKGNTPLHYAAHCGEAEAVEFLIARGADLVKVNKEGLNPLATAKESIFGAAVVAILEKATLAKS